MIWLALATILLLVCGLKLALLTCRLVFNLVGLMGSVLRVITS